MKKLKQVLERVKKAWGHSVICCPCHKCHTRRYYKALEEIELATGSQPTLYKKVFR